jgi:transcriptional regulator with XRE-family HTH domain
MSRFNTMTQSTSGLHDRLQAAAGDKTYRHLAEVTGINHETVRRYMQGGAPSVEFIASICAQLGINYEWLLTGKGPMKSADVRGHALKTSTPSELLGAMASSVERLAERVDRLEVFVQTMETRLRAGGQAQLVGVPQGVIEDKLNHHGPKLSAGSVPAAPAVGAGRARAGDIAGAIAQRPRPDAD